MHGTERVKRRFNLSHKEQEKRKDALSTRKTLKDYKDNFSCKPSIDL